MSHSRFRFTLSLCLIPWLFTTGTAVAERGVNATFTPPVPVISNKIFVPKKIPDAPAGTFSFVATFCNSNGPDMRQGLESRTVTLTNNNVLLNRNMTASSALTNSNLSPNRDMATSTAHGVGSRLFFPAVGDYSDLSLALNECVPVEYKIGLQTADRFQFEVDVWLAPPVKLSAKAPSLVQEGHLVYLHAGMGPLDPGETPIFAWQQDSGLKVKLTDADTDNPSFTSPLLPRPTQPTKLTFKVTATLNGKSQDGLVDVVVDAGKIRVDAGRDISAVGGHAVSLHAVSTPPSVLNWKWVQTKGDPVTLADDTTDNPSFTAPATGQDLEFEARVGIGVHTGKDRVVVTVIRRTDLSVHAGGDLTAVMKDTVALNCTVDGGIRPVKGWTQVDTGNGAPSVVLYGANTLTATFIAPDVTSDTIFKFKCSVRDQYGHAESQLQVTVKPPTIPLTVEAGQDQDVLEGNTVHLHGAGSGGISPLSYAWTQVTSQPISLTGADTKTPSFVAPDVSGDTPVVLDVTVTDQANATLSDSVSYNVQERTVKVTVSEHHAPSNHDVDLTAQPVGGVPPYTYVWSQNAGTTVTLNNADTDNPGFTAPSVAADETLTFEVLVTGTLHNTATGSVDVLIKGPEPLHVNAGTDLDVEKTNTASLHGVVTGGKKPYTYAWTAVPSVSLSPSATVANPHFTQGDGDVTLTLTVTDSDGHTDHDEVIVHKLAHISRMADCGRWPAGICEERFFEGTTCSANKPWGMVSTENKPSGYRTVVRKCASTQECQRLWWDDSSDVDTCENYNADALYDTEFECSWCCGGNNCNGGSYQTAINVVINNHNSCTPSEGDAPPADGKPFCYFVGADEERRHH